VVGGIGPPPPFRLAAARQRENPYGSHYMVVTEIEGFPGNTIKFYNECRVHRPTRAKLDIEGNPLEIKDARNNIPSTNKFDLLGRTLYTSSCDAGERWTFTNAVGNPIRGWDSRDHVIQSVYDELHRRTELWVAHDADPEVMAEQTVYGESLADPEVENLRGKVYQVKDGAGVVTNVEYDFKGNLLESHRQLA